MFKILRWSLVPVFLFFATPSQAITLNPKNIGAFMYGLLGAGTNTPAAQSLSGFRSAFSPFSIGMTLGAYAILRATDYALNKYNFLPGQNNPNVPVPAGWTDANTPPTTAYKSVLWRGPNNGIFENNPVGACQSMAAYLGYTYMSVNVSVPPNTVSGTCVMKTGSGSTYNNTIAYFQGECPLGYTAVGTGWTCTTPNPSPYWPSDGSPTLIQDSNHAWINHPRDPDIASDISGSSYTRTGTDQWGNPIRETFRNNPNGGMTYVRDSQTTGSNAAPSIYRDRLEFDSSGNLVDTSTGEFPNVYIDANPEERTPGQEGNSSNPDAGGGTTTPPPVETQGDCDKHPDAIGCSKYGTPQNQSPLQEKDITGTFNPTPLQGSNSCPAPLSASFLGVPLTISYDFICQFAIGIKSIVLVISTLIGMYIVLGYSTGGRS